MKRILLMMMSITFCANLAFAQKEAHVKATFVYVMPEHETPAQARRSAIKAARAQAIQEEFGSVLMQDNSVIMSTRGGESQSELFSLSEDMVKGEWIKDNKEPVVEKIVDNDRIAFRVTVDGIAREIVSAGVDVEAETLRLGTTKRHAAKEFLDGDNFYVYFKAPIDGFLTIYLFDETTKDVACMLPYQNSTSGSFAVKHDKEYVLFSVDNADGNPNEVDEYVLTTSSDKEFNTLYVIFSPNEYAKANATVGQRKLDNGLILPKSLKFPEFKKWMEKYKMKDRSMKVKSLPISITRK